MCSRIVFADKCFQDQMNITKMDSYIHIHYCIYWNFIIINYFDGSHLANYQRHANLAYNRKTQIVTLKQTITHPLVRHLASTTWSPINMELSAPRSYKRNQMNSGCILNLPSRQLAGAHLNLNTFVTLVVVIVLAVMFLVPVWVSSSKSMESIKTCKPSSRVFFKAT